MYQITELQAALTAFGGQIAGLKAAVEWATAGFTVNYVVDFRGHPIQSREPIPVHDAPRQVADELRTALVELMPNLELEAMIDGIEDCPVNMS